MRVYAERCDHLQPRSTDGSTGLRADRERSEVADPEQTGLLRRGDEGPREESHASAPRAALVAGRLYRGVAEDSKERICEVGEEVRQSPAVPDALASREVRAWPRPKRL